MPSGPASFIPLSNGSWSSGREIAADPKQKAQAVMTVSDEEVKRIAEEQIRLGESTGADGGRKRPSNIYVVAAALLARVEKLERFTAAYGHRRATGVMNTTDQDDEEFELAWAAVRRAALTGPSS